MTASLWAICAAALAGLLATVVEWIRLGQAQSTGAKLQAASTDAATGAAQAAIAQAEVAAPSTRAAVVDQLKNGSF